MSECPICGAPDGVACDMAEEQGHTEKWSLTDAQLGRIAEVARRIGVMGA